MKKIVVVVDGSPIRFNEEKTSAYYDETANYLMINDTSQEQPRKIAGFTKWDYWYYEDEETSDFGIIRPPQIPEPKRKDVLEKWFFDDLIYSPRLQEPRRLTQEYFRLEKLYTTIRKTRGSIEENNSIKNSLEKEMEVISEKQEKIEKDIIKYFKKELPQILARRYIQFFPESRWYEK